MKASANPSMYRPVVIKGEHVVSNETFINYLEQHFSSNLRDYKTQPEAAVEKARKIACSTMKIRQRYFVRPLETLHKALNPQTQRDMFINIGLKMSVEAVERALENAGVESQEINCIVFVSHQPYPFPPLTAHLMTEMSFHQDCAQIPVTSMGCGGGGFALDTALAYLRGNPSHNLLVLSVELCSLGFRPHKTGMSWFLNAALFGDAVAAFIIRGSDQVRSLSPDRPLAAQEKRMWCLELVHSKQRLVPGTTHVSYFDYDEFGYHFITTQSLCDVVRKNCPNFSRDLSMEAFGKYPEELFLNVIHPGGTRMIKEVGDALNLKGTLSETLASKCMEDGGNIASASVIDMLERVWGCWRQGDQVICVGMGPGFVMCGAALRAKRGHSLEQ